LFVAIVLVLVVQLVAQQTAGKIAKCTAKSPSKTGKHCQITVTMLLTMLSCYWQWHSDETGVEMPTQWQLAVRITVKSP
jgi:hypothetical protein